ncbi:MAG: hypothetical protein E7347_03740 [Clostridiales bacterium]|nr:hypothetical protein [Clostridiales bacterium]
MKKIGKLPIILISVLTLLIINPDLYCGVVYADTLSENIEEQMSKLDLSQLSIFFDSLFLDGKINIDFFECVNSMLKGDITLEFNSINEYLFKTILGVFFEFLPTFLSVIAISVLCGIVQNARSKYLSEGVGEVTFYVCLMGVVLLLGTQIISLWQNIENIIKNIAKLTEIMSPIILTLMMAVGGNVSASVYKPAVAVLSNGVVSVVLYLIMPLVALMTVFNVLGNFSTSIKLSKFSEFISSTIKWIIGLMVAIFGLFLSVQGITSAHFDGISIKATKYAISNSVPIIGGFIKDGLDLIIAGSVIIKNSIGVTILFALFYMIISPVLYLAIFSLLLKLTSAIIEPICDVRIPNFCLSISKTVTYLTVSLISVGFMLFITVLLMILSANAFF